MLSSRLHQAALFLSLGLLCSSTSNARNIICDSSVLRDSTLSSKEILCTPLGDDSAAPALDGDLSDWANDVAKNRLALTSALGMLPYSSGDVSIMCTYDETKIYMAFEVPGPYRFNATDDHLCASISTMWRIGDNAQYMNMGGCPHVKYGEKCTEVPELCNPFRVDLGGHWELKTTEMGVEYGTDLTSGSGNDPIANKDDEWAVSPYCRPDDDDGLAANEWAGAWIHTNPNATDTTDHESYIFEMSRLLTTASELSDIQLEAGGTYDFGFAYWDPFESQDEGWSKAGHYVTGCSRDWVPLKLATESGEEPPSSVATTTNALQTAFYAVAFFAFAGLV
eukprot:CAMPEP_0203647368 /NCGR_PEP_ID=MMETSP0088-20131115/15610_1 /ASSEMBLY_ACC=CAM_ASM_001087 /TAXON_ID=426623 /ORGANISM="Chaetoceros affinis, Strain CCMP159" /LENGTH=336 /DNA_ID=CAMNT_0050504981 /DNA_START=9 /DNA_END=1019 /DNA_ORIENTATION=+